MKKGISLVVACWAIMSVFVYGQPPVPGISEGSSPLQIRRSVSANAEEEKQLGSNYRLTFTAKSGEKVLGEVALVTCSTRIQINGAFGSTESRSSLVVEGNLKEEEDGRLLFSYSLGSSVPEVLLPQDEGQNINQRTTQYRSHTVSGCLMVKTGKEYEIFRSGGIVHFVTVTPEKE